ncbi:MAG: hypothetical protein R3E97_22290 [Candidatus Eisenbacteria bacterium]
MNQVEMRAMRTRLGVSRSFAEDRSRSRRRFFTTAAVLVVFACGFGRVWLTTEVADQVSEVHRLEQRIEQLHVDISIASAQLDESRTFAQLAGPASEAGLQLDGPRASVTLPAEAGEENVLRDALVQDLRRGSQLVLTEALAGTRSVEQVRASVSR